NARHYFWDINSSRNALLAIFRPLLRNFSLFSPLPPHDSLLLRRLINLLLPVLLFHSSPSTPPDTAAFFRRCLSDAAAAFFSFHRRRVEIHRHHLCFSVSV
ncbi:hypothetical protein LINGRAHAP2_LOCUS27730, partial [Linum grandiflorum]